MIRKTFLFLLIIIFFNCFNIVFGNQNFFEEAKKKFDDKKLEESKFLFQRNIVYHPKNANSYLYLAKIFNSEENQKEEEKNLKTALLLEPDNEEAMYMLIEIQLKNSNYSSVRELSGKFTKICKKLCTKIEKIEETLKNIEPKNES